VNKQAPQSMQILIHLYEQIQQDMR